MGRAAAGLEASAQGVSVRKHGQGRHFREKQTSQRIDITEVSSQLQMYSSRNKGRWRRNGESPLGAFGALHRSLARE